MPRIKDLFIATRPWSFNMSVISVALGTALAWREAPLRPGWALLVVLGVVLCHAAGNVLNDYFDSKNRVDDAESATAIYRPHPIVGGLLSPRAVLLEAVVLLAVAACAGIVLFAFRSTHVLWIAIAGLALTVLYTGGPVHLKYRALGEVAVFLIWGPLMFLGAFAVQAGTLSGTAVVLSVPFGVLVALVLFANNIRDIASDRRSRIRTLGTVLGERRGVTAFVALMLSAYVYTLFAIVTGALTPWALLVLLSLPIAVGLARTFRRALPSMADAMTAKLDVVFGLLFLLALVLDRVTTK